MADLRWTFFPPLPRDKIGPVGTVLTWKQVEQLANEISDQLECHASSPDDTPVFDRLANVKMAQEEMEVADEKTLDFVYLCHFLARLNALRNQLLACGIDRKLIESFMSASAGTQLFLDKFYTADLNGVLAIGNRRVAATRKTGLSNRKSTKQKKQEYAAAKKALETVICRCPNWSKTAQMKAAAEKLSISLSTLKRRLRAPD